MLEADVMIGNSGEDCDYDYDIENLLNGWKTCVFYRREILWCRNVTRV